MEFLFEDPIQFNVKYIDTSFHMYQLIRQHTRQRLAHVNDAVLHSMPCIPACGLGNHFPTCLRI